MRMNPSSGLTCIASRSPRAIDESLHLAVDTPRRHTVSSAGGFVERDADVAIIQLSARAQTGDSSAEAAPTFWA